MSLGSAGRPGGAELAIARRATIAAVIGWFFADLSSGLQSPVALSLTFLLWLGTLLAAARAALALAIGVWKRTHQRH
ncbi:hypothetical protein [Aeromicrobium sp.]|uniref:hypothetical protein n=1 Tax=Aeromicrobium sp. TaxID=1871063 RepID=UPI003C4B3295